MTQQLKTARQQEQMMRHEELKQRKQQAVKDQQQANREPAEVVAKREGMFESFLSWLDGDTGKNGGIKAYDKRNHQLRIANDKNLAATDSIGADCYYDMQQAYEDRPDPPAANTMPKDLQNISSVSSEQT